MKLFTRLSEGSLRTSNLALLLITLITIFIVPFFPIEFHQIIYSVCYSILFLLSVLSIEKANNRIVITAIIVVVLEWITEFWYLPILHVTSLMVTIIFFDLIVVLFITQIARAKSVTPRILMESVIAYLLLGLSFAIMMALITHVDPTAFSFPHLKEPMLPEFYYIGEYIYYSFVTLTTLGYGDIVPLTPAAKSFSIFTAITGQMYVAIIIATLVSKYLGQRNGQ